MLKICDFGSAKQSSGEPNVRTSARATTAHRSYLWRNAVLHRHRYLSAGCVIGEMLVGQPLFPGGSGVDQVVELLKVLGTPSRDELFNMNGL